MSCGEFELSFGAARGERGKELTAAESARWKLDLLLTPQSALRTPHSAVVLIYCLLGFCYALHVNYKNDVWQSSWLE